MNMPELVGIGKVATVPSDQEIAGMVRGDGQVQRIAQRVARHDVVLDVELDDLLDVLRQGQLPRNQG